MQPEVCVSDGVKVVNENAFLQFQLSLMSGQESIHVGNYLQSFRYFATSGLPFELLTKNFGREWIKKHGIDLGIHVRRTDQLTKVHGGNDPGADYFKTALAILRQRVSGPLKAVVCTDDTSWVLAQSVFDGMLIRNGTSEKDAIQDLAILASTRHMIMSIGTFGWWGAYMRANDGETFYYAKPFLRSLDYFDHFPGFWTPVSDQDISRERRYQKHLENVLQGCGEICDLGIKGRPSLFFDYIPKHFNCMSIGTNAAIDAEGWETPPPVDIPHHMRAAFTFDGLINVSSFYSSQKYLNHKAMVSTIWSYDYVNDLIAKAARRELEGPYGVSETNWVIEGLAKMSLNGADVLVIGSENPWVEACVLAAGAYNVTTLEYGQIIRQHPQITTVTPSELRIRFHEFISRFDAVVTFSSVEYSGLGRYGDAINPYGDKQGVRTDSISTSGR